MLPGGVGSFDLVALIGLGQLGMPSEHILASLILYRIFYYMLPLVLGIIFTLILQGQNKNDDIRLMHLGKLKNIINQASGLTNILLSILIFFSGVVLLTSALVPGIATRIKLAAKLMSFPILQLSNQLSITAGVLLITISKDISMKVKRSYKFTWWLLLLGAIFTFLKGFDYEEAIFLGIVLILLRMSKTSFYRRSTPFDWFWTLISSIFALIGVIIYFRLSHRRSSIFWRSY